MDKNQIKQLFDSYRERLMRCQVEYQRARIKADIAAGVQSPIVSDIPRGGASGLKDVGERVADYLDDMELVQKELAVLLEVEKRLRGMLWLLPAEYSETMKLIYFDCFTREEAAEKLSISLSGVRMRIKRSLEMMASNWRV